METGLKRRDQQLIGICTNLRCDLCLIKDTFLLAKGLTGPSTVQATTDCLLQSRGFACHLGQLSPNTLHRH
jgi:hypothetical protein